MSTVRRPATFAEIVRAVDAADVESEERRAGRAGSGFAAGGALVDPAGRRYRQVHHEVSAARAREIAREGGTVAWDGCGCRGGCPVTWVAEDEVARLVAAGTPRIRRTKRKRGSASEWQDEGGRRLVLLEGDVEWGDALG